MIRRLLWLLALSLLMLTPLSGWAADGTWSVAPLVAYPDTIKSGDGASRTVYGMTVLLDGATFPATSYWLRFEGNTPLLACALPQPKCDVDVLFQIGGTGINQLVFSKIPAKFAGARKFTIQAVGDPLHSGTLQIAFALAHPGAVRVVAVIVVGLLVAIVLALLLYGRSGPILANRTSVKLLQAAFIDVETRTYSLSKLQFYVWGFAVIAGYIYFTIARSLIQGAFEFADVPSNLALLMGISVGTTVTSLGVGSLAGSKGAGDIGPLPSDLITSGGVVAPERLMHLLWTLVGGLAFVFFAFSIPPENINNLPSVPDGFLELMGVSAAGYVGGKIARGPGPVIQTITMDPPAGATATPLDPLPVEINGVNLATVGASYLMAQVRPALGKPDTPVHLVGFEPGSVIDDATNTATRIKTSIAAIPPDLVFAVGNRYRFTIVNPDGEKAVWEFDVK